MPHPTGYSHSPHPTLLPMHEIYVLLHPPATFTLTTVITMYANTRANQMKIKMASLNLIHALHTISYRLPICG